jgi:hypothetical protein
MMLAAEPHLEKGRVLYTNVQRGEANGPRSEHRRDGDGSQHYWDITEGQLRKDKGDHPSSQGPAELPEMLGSSTRPDSARLLSSSSLPLTQGCVCKTHPVQSFRAKRSFHGNK